VGVRGPGISVFGLPQINSIPEVRVFLHNFTEQIQKLTRTTSASRCYSFTARNWSLVFNPEKLTFSISSLHKTTYKSPGSYSLPYSLPSLWKIRKRISQLSPFDHATWQHPRENPRNERGSVRIYVVRVVQFARIPRLPVSAPFPIMAPARIPTRTFTRSPTQTQTRTRTRIQSWWFGISRYIANFKGPELQFSRIFIGVHAKLIHENETVNPKFYWLNCLWLANQTIWSTTGQLFSTLNLHNFWVLFKVGKSVYLKGGSIRAKNTKNENNHLVLIKEESMYTFKVKDVSQRCKRLCSKKLKSVKISD